MLGAILVTTVMMTHSGVLTIPELYRLADQARASVPDCPPELDSHWLVAMALKESGGDPKARGDKEDGVYQAWGLLQFHRATWHGIYPIGATRPSRDDPLASMRACLIYAMWGLKAHGLRERKDWRKYDGDYMRQLASTKHNAGHCIEVETKYSKWVHDKRIELMKASVTNE